MEKRIPQLPFLHVPAQHLLADLAANGRGERKIAVVAIHPEKERLPDSVDWNPGEVALVGKGGCAVAAFNQNAPSIRHCHLKTEEIYIVLKGGMHILVEGADQKVSRRIVEEGSLILISPGVPHQFISAQEGGEDCFALAIAPHSYGAEDNFVQLSVKGEWVCRDSLSLEQRANVFRWNPEDFPSVG